jgi:hypothetical protein
MQNMDPAILQEEQPMQPERLSSKVPALSSGPKHTLKASRTLTGTVAPMQSGKETMALAMHIPVNVPCQISPPMNLQSSRNSQLKENFSKCKLNANDAIHSGICL